MLGRADDIINIGGEKVSPIEVENVATEFDVVHDAACIGIPDEIMGQVPVLFVDVGEPYKEEELIHFLTGRLESFKLPRQIIRVSQIPRNRMKKLDRKAVKKLWEKRGKEKAEKKGDDFYHFILSRHSTRIFQDKRIKKEILENLIDAGIQAPTGHNLQTWRFSVITSKEVILQIKEIGSSVAKREKTGFTGFINPDTLIIISNDIRNDCGIQDVACAAENIMLAAHGYGLGSCWLNGLTRISDQPEIKELLDAFSIPKTHRVYAMIALGYPKGDGIVPVRKTNVVNWVE